MKKRKKLFELQTDLTSYTYPLTKVIICLLIIPALIFRNHFIHFSSAWAATAFTVLCFVIMVANILCLEISVGEMMETYWNRKENKSQPLEADSKLYTLDEIVHMAEICDIIEIKLYANGSAVIIGSSADSKPGRSDLFDKRYYVGKEEFPDISGFKNALRSYAVDGKLSVLAIDGIQP